MSTSGRPPIEPTSLGDLPDPSDDAAAAALVDTFEHDAAQLEPTDRLPELRAAVAARGSGLRGHPGWAAAVACVALVAVTGGVGLALDVGRDGTTPATRDPVPPSTVASPAPTSDAPSPQPSGSPSPSSPSSSAAPVVYVLPVYYLGPDGDRLGLVREFHRREVSDVSGASLVGPMQLALDEATDPSKVLDPDYSAPWQPRQQALDVRGPTAGVLTVNLPASEATARGRTAEQARLAAQQLVWTATAVAKDAGLGVRLLIDGRSGRLFGSLPVGSVMHRASPSYEVLSGIWVEAPGERQRTTSPVTVRGSACVFEASVSWELIRDGSVLHDGHTMADAGCPTRGSWTVALGRLPAGEYTFRAFAEPASGEGAAQEDTRRFEVR